MSSSPCLRKHPFIYDNTVELQIELAAAHPDSKLQPPSSWRRLGALLRTGVGGLTAAANSGQLRFLAPRRDDGALAGASHFWALPKKPPKQE